MDNELMVIQLEQDFNELAEQYDSAADNEMLWALGAPDAEGTRMHTQNMVHNREMAKLYRTIAHAASALLDLYMEDN